MSDGSIRINTKIDRKGAEQGLVELKRSVDTKVKQLEKGVTSAGNEVNKLNDKFMQTSKELENVEMKMDLVGDRIFETYRDFQGKMSDANFDSFIKSQIEADSEYKKLITKQEQLQQKVEGYKTKLESAKSKQTELNSSLGQAKKEQANVNSKLEEAKKKAEAFKEKMKEASKNTKKVSVENLGISKTLGTSVKKLAKYAVALLGFRGIYSLLKSSMNEWLNGSSKEAKQLQADITNLKANIGAALAPAIQSVLNIFYKILAVVGAIVKSFANINIFAKNTAKSTASTAASAKKASNSMASWDEKTTLQDNSNSGGAGGSDVVPTDLSSLMSKYEELAEKIKSIFEFIFEPFKKAWETTGESVIGAMNNAFDGIKNLCIAVGSSFAKIWTNGTVQTTAELLLSILANILNIIGNITRAFANAWIEVGKGDKIIQALANAINNVLEVVKKITWAFTEWWKTDSAQSFASSIISIIQTVSGWIENLTKNLKKIWDNGGKHAFTSLLNAVSKITQMFDIALQAIDPYVQAIENLAGDALSGLLEAIGWVIDKFNEFSDWILGNSEDCDTFAVIVGSIATAILLVVSAITIWNVVGAIATGVTTALGVAVNILTSPITLVVLAIAALIAIVVLLYKNWDTISQALSEGWQWLKEKATEIFTAIGQFFSDIWESIKETAINVWNAIKDFFSNLWESITTTISNVWNSIKTTIANFVIGIYNGIVEKFNAVKTFISTIFTTIKTTISNIWNNIKTTIANVITTIVDGIKEKFNNMKTNITNIFTNIKNSVVNIFNNIKSSLINIVSNMWTAIKNKFSTLGTAIGEAISGAVKTAINWILNKIESVINSFFKLINGGIDVINAIPGVNITKLNMLSIPKLARGGIVNQPTQAIIGEAGKEAVLPLENNTEWMDILAQKIAEMLNIEKNDDGDIYVNVILDGETIQRQQHKRKSRLQLATNGRCGL